ncbi:hypothetical protein [Hydrocarboniclastica marina]|uniref:DUF4412 domain-containing protein n=1 Tax=Hydrocarboniclastica marina TaxID=2259620 RepID=A0A4V1D973_9ALTE|nr:hypothetical protein [Hydrocarboniclastica marina]MAM00431.1 hypothetical protein [Alteromonadaceae bacterium]QCF27690.1 hypothetical protein soil367_18135 [Hydrocarboniclastica marina]|tara:strand:+ start:1690 stop:2355 length:666 start_codon:yes stop_codon:yes gene_type:complete
MYKTLLTLVLIFTTATAYADLAGRYRLPGNNTLEVYYKDDKTLRADIAPHGYLLLNGDQMFMVMEKAGMRMAMDLEQMGSMVSTLRNQALAPDQKAADLVPEIQDTGRQETVAGYEGQVHQVKVGNNRSEVVLTKDPQVTKITKGFITAAVRLGQVLSAEDREAAAAAIEQLEQSGYGGLLKQAGGVQLEAIRTQDRPDSFYRLPPNTPLVQLPMFKQPAQ